MTSAPRIFFSFFTPLFSFSFFISCSAPETAATLTCQPHTHTVYEESHTQTYTQHMKSHTYKHGLTMILCHTVLWIYRKSRKHTEEHKNKYTLNYCNDYPILHRDILRLRCASHLACRPQKRKKNKAFSPLSPSFLLSSILNPPLLSALYLRGCFQVLNPCSFQVHSGLCVILVIKR